MNPSENLDFTLETPIRAETEVVWKALVEPEQVNFYHMCPLHQIELKKGAQIIYGTEQEVMLSGEIVDFCEAELLSIFRPGGPVDISRWCQPPVQNI